MGGDAQMLMSLIGDLGALGFVLWMAWRMTNHTIPRLAKSFEDATDRQRNDFKEMLKEQRDSCATMMEREREVHGQHVDRIVETLKELRAA